MKDDPVSGYVRVNELEMYYEARGAGSPLVLLHGGLTTFQATFARLLPAFTKDRRVIGVEQQGHGHTADIDRPLTFEQEADDTAEVLRQLGVEQADVFGYSDGGNVALGLAIRHPSLVKKLVTAGTNFTNEGLQPGIVEYLRSASSAPPAEAAAALPDVMRQDYEQVAPRPEDWPRLVSKVMQQATAFPGWSQEQLRSIGADTLLLIGDRDLVTPEHAVEMFRLLPRARLAVLPGADHGMLDTHPQWITAMVEDFLAAPPS